MLVTGGRGRHSRCCDMSWAPLRSRPVCSRTKLDLCDGCDWDFTKDCMNSQLAMNGMSMEDIEDIEGD